MATVSRSSRAVPRALVAVAALALLGVAAGTGAVPAAATAPPLRPDLVTMRIHEDDLVVTKEGTATLLGLSNRLANRGRGPLEIFPSSTSHDCDSNPANPDRDAFQRIFEDTNGDGVFERETDTGFRSFMFGCERYDPDTGFWDVFDLARYKLLQLHGGKPLAKSTKVAFCTVDGQHPFPGLPGSPVDGYYPTDGCNETSTLGVSVGWADEYYYALPGQQLDVSGVSPGRYCLVSTGDPHNLLRESDNSNNTRKTRIRLNPAKQTAIPLQRRCRLGR
jgi:Lysyl oxidase